MKRSFTCARAADRSRVVGFAHNVRSGTLYTRSFCARNAQSWRTSCALACLAALGMIAMITSLRLASGRGFAALVGAACPVWSRRSCWPSFQSPRRARARRTRDARACSSRANARARAVRKNAQPAASASTTHAARHAAHMATAIAIATASRSRRATAAYRIIARA